MGEPRALLLTPNGRDGDIAGNLLREAGIGSVVCHDAASLHSALGVETAFVVITEEVIRSADLRGVLDWVQAQPSWSDLPFVILTQRGGGPERNPAAARLSEVFRNVLFLERPFHPTTFVSLAKTALGIRKRQYEAKARMEELRRLTATLEQRVALRTAELECAHAAILQEAAQRERAEEQLRQAQKVEMIGQLTGAVAHDFNNLLMAVLSNLELLKRNIPEQPKTSRLIDGAMRGAHRGAALTQRLLAFARRQALTIAPGDVCELVRGMNELLERSVGQDVELQISLPDAPAKAWMDANQVELALLNLAVNARDATPQGGSLRITVDVVDVEASHDLSAGSYVRLSVVDTGHGMDAETLARAAEPFFSTKELGKGTGLGLSMVHGLAAQLDGALRLTSEVGHGTRAELWLPAAHASEDFVTPEVSSRASAANPSDGHAKCVVLFVDDDALIAMSTVDMLEDLGHKVIEVNSGAKALEVLRAGEAVDILLTDFSMPKMNGAQLAGAARALRPDLPILLATGFADLPPGAELDIPRLAKPYGQEQLATEINRLVNK